MRRFLYGAYDRTFHSCWKFTISSPDGIGTFVTRIATVSEAAADTNQHYLGIREKRRQMEKITQQRASVPLSVMFLEDVMDRECSMNVKMRI
jgi:hypothetical protein